MKAKADFVVQFHGVVAFLRKVMWGVSGWLLTERAASKTTVSLQPLEIAGKTAVLPIELKRRFVRKCRQLLRHDLFLSGPQLK